MPKYTAAIFDLDGTLLDSMKVWEQVDREFLGRRKLSFTPDYTEKVSAMSFAEAARYTVERFHLGEAPEELMREWNEMVTEQYAHHIVLKPGARECLRFLRERGFVFGVATALSPQLYGPVLCNNGIYDEFRAFASVPEVARGKEFPDVYLLCAKRLGAEPGGCIVFEDVLEGLRGAKAAGMAAVGVHDAISGLSEQTARTVADGYIRTLHQVRQREFALKFLQ
ncbi:MAG: HAD family phosphatase [Oscillospiraceae bacterium]|nr:HAD family phosphatase [Oscillospiraceae bacterium]